MKARDIQRSVRVQRQIRSAGDAPSIGRVSRMPGVGRPKGERRRRRRSEGGRGNRTRNNRTKVVVTWSIVIVVLVLGGLAVALAFWLRAEMGQNRVAIERTATVPRLEARIASEFPSPSEEDALVLVKAALGVRDPEMVGRYFNPGSTKPEAVIDFLKNLESGEREITRFTWLSSMDANNMLLDGVLVNVMDAGVPRGRLVLLTPDSVGDWRVDFESFARVTDPSWDELLEGDGEQALVRVMISKDSYYNRSFRDERKWVCYRMQSQDLERDLFGYCRIDSPQAMALDRIVQKIDSRVGWDPVKRATLDIRHYEGVESHQFEIFRVLAEDWVVSDVVFEDNFK